MFSSFLCVSADWAREEPVVISFWSLIAERILQIKYILLSYLKSFVLFWPAIEDWARELAGQEQNQTF